MRMTREEARKRFPDRPAPTPANLAGQWVAWNADFNGIIAHGDKFDEVRAQAIAAGYQEPLMQRVLSAPRCGTSSVNCLVRKAAPVVGVLASAPPLRLQP